MALCNSTASGSSEASDGPLWRFGSCRDESSDGSQI